MNKQQLEQYENAAVGSVFKVIASTNDKVALERILTMVTSMTIALLRGLHGDEYVEGYLKAAIADRSNIITVETAPIQ